RVIELLLLVDGYSPREICAGGIVGRKRGSCNGPLLLSGARDGLAPPRAWHLHSTIAGCSRRAAFRGLPPLAGARRVTGVWRPCPSAERCACTGRTAWATAPDTKGKVIVTDREREDYRRNLLGLANRIKGDMTDLAGEALRKAGGEASGNLSNTPLH